MNIYILGFISILLFSSSTALCASLEDREAEARERLLAAEAAYKHMFFPKLNEYEKEFQAGLRQLVEEHSQSLAVIAAEQQKNTYQLMELDAQIQDLRRALRVSRGKQGVIARFRAFCCVCVEPEEKQ